MAEPADLSINSLRGGMCEDPPNLLAEDMCVLAENVEWFYSALGERRAGCNPLDLTSAGLGAQAVIAHISQWLPTNKIAAPEFWAIGATAGVSVAVARKNSGVWSAVSPTDAILTASPGIYEIVSQPLNGKLFWAYPSAADRLHVWDTVLSSLRRVGLAAPGAAPTAADEGAGTFSGTRYYRVRYAQMNGTVVIRRGEPSAVLTKAPSTTGAGFTVTKPAAISEGETHWELEASTDNVLFYRIARTAVGTATVNDEVVYATGYAAAGTISETIGTYLCPPSARYIAVDGDRLLMAGHWTDTTLQSRVSWTPVHNDPGDSNDERLPLSTNNYKDLDNFEGGPITGISSAVNGTWYAFKWSHIYKMTRTGDLDQAYDVLTVSKSRGAIQGSIFDGVDEYGAPCTYFLDPTMGPSRIGSGGLQVLVGLGTTWNRVNLNAANIVARGLYYPFKQQAIWYFAADGAENPNYGIKCQISELRGDGAYAVRRGWSTVTGRITQVYSMAVLTEVSIINEVVSLSGYPFVGLSSPDFIQRCDVDTQDAGVAYVARIRTKPYFPAGLLNRWGEMTMALLATAGSGSIGVRVVRDFDLETNRGNISLAPAEDEEFVIRAIDNLSMSGAVGLQFEFADPD